MVNVPVPVREVEHIIEKPYDRHVEVERIVEHCQPVDHIVHVANEVDRCVEVPMNKHVDKICLESSETRHNICVDRNIERCMPHEILRRVDVVVHKHIDRVCPTESHREVEVPIEKIAERIMPID